MLTSSTHDTKRSEDVRARLNVLSEMPRDWERAMQRWQAFNRDKKIEVDGSEVPDVNEEYLFYQTLVGVWPLLPMDEEAYAHFISRLEHYMEKALKEAKRHTSWVNPNEVYDEAMKRFVREVLTPAPGNPFIEDFGRFHTRVAQAGMWNSLSQTLLKLTSPGVPDIYQGNELWDFSLVDPDNRQRVDFGLRAALLEELQRSERRGLSSLLRELIGQRSDGRLKLYITYKTLNLRRTHRDLFERGTYHALTVTGDQAQHVVAYARQLEERWVLVVVPRFVHKLSQSTRPPVGKRLWKETRLELPEGAPARWRNVFTGEQLTSANHPSAAKGLYVHELFRRLPVALLA
jgi:(1->4)-alpha-D-glucan 1-alpha-D-glucosylmutase